MLPVNALRTFTLLTIVLLYAGCNTISAPPPTEIPLPSPTLESSPTSPPTPIPPSSTPTAVPPTATAQRTATRTPTTTATPEPSPSLSVFTPELAPTGEPSPTPKLKGVRYFLIAPDTGGPFGCGDGLIYFTSEYPPSGNVEKDIKNALRALFKLKVKEVGGYYNPVYNAHLIVNEVNFDASTGKVVIHLSGSIPKPEDECEADRVHDVVWETVRKFPGVNSVGIWVGNFLLGDLIAVGDS